MTQLVPIAATAITGAPTGADAQLQAVQDMRFGMLQFITQNGLPDDPKQQMVYLAALNDATRHALGVKRIESDENTAKGSQDAALAIANAVFGQAGLIKHATHQETDREVPMLTQEDGEVYVIEGELAIGAPTLTYEQFITQTNDNASVGN